MALRNFYASIDAEGRASRLAAGPRSKNGTLDVNVKVDDNDYSRDVLDVCCRTLPDGTRMVTIYIYGDGTKDSEIVVRSFTK